MEHRDYMSPVQQHQSPTQENLKRRNWHYVMKKVWPNRVLSLARPELLQESSWQWWATGGISLISRKSSRRLGSTEGFPRQCWVLETKETAAVQVFSTANCTSGYQQGVCQNTACQKCSKHSVQLSEKFFYFNLINHMQTYPWFIL